MKIFKTKDTTLELWRLIDWISNKDVFGKRIGISWKKGKKRKLRSYLINWNIWECDCCGHVTSVELTKNGKTFRMDNHLGLGLMHMSDL